MIIWSPSSWALWKQCPAKYRIKQLDRWKYPKPREDANLSKLAIPGLVVDKLLQLWLHRRQFEDKAWLGHNFDMIWSLVVSEISPHWREEESELIKFETIEGVNNAATLINSLELSQNQFTTQASFFEKISNDCAITGAADLLVINQLKRKGILVDFKNSNSRIRLTKDQLVIYQIGLEQKLSIEIHRAGYMMFNPRLNSWKWFTLENPAHKDKLIHNLHAANQQIRSNNFEYRWNRFTCIRFCEVRYSCELFQHYTGRITNNITVEST